MVDTAAHHIQEFYERFNGEKDAVFTAAVGDTVEVKVEGNPTTGYTWIANTDNLSVVSPLNVNAEYKTGEYQATHNDGRVGGGGVFSFKFAVVSAGSENVALNYKRPWEPTSVRTLNIKVTSK